MTSILVVDDAVLDQQVAGGYVEAMGETPVYAGNGREALEVMAKECPSVVLTDLQMPEMNGLELVREIRLNYPKVPVILMTAFGSEDVAVEALRAGASSYVPKKELKTLLHESLRAVLASLEAAKHAVQVRDFLEVSETKFVLGYEANGQQALISFLQETLTSLHYCDETELMQVSTALTEVLANAIDHGNLELDSEMREDDDGSYRALGDERAKQLPYSKRRVFVTSRLTPTEATYIIRDEGPGFNPETLPDPLDPENIIKPFGRGIMLIRTFMDEVRFNETGNEVTMVKRRSSP